MRRCCGGVRLLVGRGASIKCPSMFGVIVLCGVVLQKGCSNGKDSGSGFRC